MQVQQYPIQPWLAAYFLNLIDNQGVRKFEVSSNADGNKEKLLVRTKHSFPLILLSTHTRFQHP
jgi:hypothetical protein